MYNASLSHNINVIVRTACTTTTFSTSRNSAARIVFLDPIRISVKDTYMYFFQQESLPPFPLCGMVNKHGGKVRLTFKLESDQLWLSTKDRTEKLPMGSIKNIVSEPIQEHEEYHIMVIHFFL